MKGLLPGTNSAPVASSGTVMNMPQMVNSSSVWAYWPLAMEVHRPVWYISRFRPSGSALRTVSAATLPPPVTSLTTM